MFEDAGDLNNVDPDMISEMPGSNAAHDAVARQQGMSGLGQAEAQREILSAIGTSTGFATDAAKAIGGAGIAGAQAKLQALRQRGEISQAQYQAQMAQLQEKLRGGSFFSRNKWWILMGVVVIGAGVWWYRKKRGRPVMGNRRR